MDPDCRASREGCVTPWVLPSDTVYETQNLLN